jgi:hypothetical protein
VAGGVDIVDVDVVLVLVVVLVEQANATIAARAAASFRIIAILQVGCRVRKLCRISDWRLAIGD